MKDTFLESYSVGINSIEGSDWIRNLKANRDALKESFCSIFDRYRLNLFEIDFKNDLYPDAEALSWLVSIAPSELEFIIKLPPEMTSKVFDDTGAFVINEWKIETFIKSISALIETNRVSFINMEFQSKFVKDEDTIEFLTQFTKQFRKLAKVVVSMNSESWYTPSAFDKLRRIPEIEIGYHDKPEIAGGTMIKPEVVDSIGFIRFSGRSTKWIGAKSGERYDYSYTETDFYPLLSKISKLYQNSEKLYLIFANATKGYALDNAITFSKMLRAYISGR